jgi:hypothetical protein
MKRGSHCSSKNKCLQIGEGIGRVLPDTSSAGETHKIILSFAEDYCQAGITHGSQLHRAIYRLQLAQPYSQS